MNEKDTISKLLEEAKKAVRDKRLQQAGALLEQALAIDPSDIPCLDLMGFVRFFQRRYEDGERCCRNALERAPRHAYAMAGLGMCLARQGRLDEGISHLQQAMSIQPRWAEPYWDLAIVLKEAGRYDEAITTLERGISACPESRKRFEGLIKHIEVQKKKR
jgi:tetratricopeptide (TPR) repeat protein